MYEQAISSLSNECIEHKPELAAELVLLGELQLAIVGGGIGEVVFA